jgi:hypothetical protein
MVRGLRRPLGVVLVVAAPILAVGCGDRGAQSSSSSNESSPSPVDAVVRPTVPGETVASPSSLTAEEQATAIATFQTNQQIAGILSAQSAAVTGMQVVGWFEDASKVGAALEVALSKPITIAEEHPEFSRRNRDAPGYQIEISPVRHDNVTGLIAYVDFARGEVVAFEATGDVISTYPPDYAPPPPLPDG